jgi:hypothetical protein
MASITKDDLNKIVELAKSVPEEYRDKCFELLLARALQDAALATAHETPPVPAGPAPTSAPPKFVLPIDVKAFLSQYSLDESLLWKCFHAEGGELRPIYQLRTRMKARAQIEHALMMALESAMTSGQFQVALEALRQRCRDHKCYDEANFMGTLKRNSNLFKKLDADEPLLLSPDGKAELAELLESLKD